MRGKNSQTFECKCGMTQAWITEGEEKKKPCPYCGRRYKGVYNPKKLQIEAIETKE